MAKFEIVGVRWKTSPLLWRTSTSGATNIFYNGWMYGLLAAREYDINKLTLIISACATFIVSARC